MATQLKMNWTGNMKGHGAIEAERLNAPVAIPQGLGGSGEGTNPKALLLSSAASCYLLTLVAILQNKKLSAAELTLSSEVSDIKENDFSISHQVHVTLSDDATEEQVQAAKSAFEMADKACAIGNILKKAGAQISVDGTVALAENLAA